MADLSKITDKTYGDRAVEFREQLGEFRGGVDIETALDIRNMAGKMAVGSILTEIHIMLRHLTVDREADQ